jgi:hypothetical protein
MQSDSLLGRPDLHVWAHTRNYVREQDLRAALPAVP